MSKSNKGPKGRASSGEPPKEEDKSKFTRTHEGAVSGALKKNIKKVAEPIVYKKATVNLERIKDTYRGFKVPELKDEDIITAVDEAGRELPKELKKEYYDIVVLYSPYDKVDVIALHKDLMDNIDLKGDHPDDPRPHIALVDKAMDTGAIPALKQIEEALERTTYLFIYMTNNLCEDAWAELATHECLMEALNNKEAMWTIVPIHTSERRTKPYKVPFGLRSLKGIERSDSDPFFYENVKLLVDSSRYRFYRKHREQRDKAEDWIFEKVGTILKDRKKRTAAIPEQLNSPQEALTDEDRRRILLAELQKVGGVPPDMAGVTAGSPHYQPPGAYGGHPGYHHPGHVPYSPQGKYPEYYPHDGYQPGHPPPDGAYYHPGPSSPKGAYGPSSPYGPGHPVRGQHVQPQPALPQPNVVVGEIVNQPAAGQGAVYHIHAQHVNIGDNSKINVNRDASTKDDDDDDAAPRFKLAEPVSPPVDPPGPPPGPAPFPIVDEYGEKPSVDNRKKIESPEVLPSPAQIIRNRVALIPPSNGSGHGNNTGPPSLPGLNQPRTVEARAETQPGTLSVHGSFSTSSSGRGSSHQASGGSNARPTLGSQQSPKTISVGAPVPDGSANGGAVPTKATKRQASVLTPSAQPDATHPFPVNNQLQKEEMDETADQPPPFPSLLDIDEPPTFPSLCDNERSMPSFDVNPEPLARASGPRSTEAPSVTGPSGVVKTSLDVPLPLKDLPCSYTEEEEEAFRRKLQGVTLSETEQQPARHTSSICLGGDQLKETAPQQPSSNGKATPSAASTSGRVNMLSAGVSYSRQGSGVAHPVLKGGYRPLSTKGYEARPPPTPVDAFLVGSSASSGSSEPNIPRTIDSETLSTSSSNDSPLEANTSSGRVPRFVDEPLDHRVDEPLDHRVDEPLDHRVKMDSSELSKPSPKKGIFSKLFSRR